MDWNYLAGFFDGEGNFHVIPVKKIGERPIYSLQIRIYGTNKELLEKIKSFLGYGKIYLKNKETINRAEVFQFTIIKKQNCKNFLENVGKFLIDKKKQANYLEKNFSFENGNPNSFFNIEEFVSFIKRRNVQKFRKHKRYTE